MQQSKSKVDQGFEIIDTFSDDDQKPNKKLNDPNDSQTSLKQNQLPTTHHLNQSFQNKTMLSEQNKSKQSEVVQSIEKGQNKQIEQSQSQLQQKQQNEEDEDDTEVLHKNISKIYTIVFSQTGKTVGLGTEDGLRIQSTENTNNPAINIPNINNANSSNGIRNGKQKRYIMEKEQNKYNCGMKQISLLYDTYICAFVTDNKNKQYPDTKVYIYDIINSQQISEYQFYSPILSIYYMREYLLVANEKRLVLYDIVQKKPLKYILDIYAPSNFNTSFIYDSFTYAYTPNHKGTIVVTNVWYNNPVCIDINQELGQQSQMQLLSQSQQQQPNLLQSQLLQSQQLQQQQTIQQREQQRNVDISNMVLSPDGSLLAACEKGGHIIKIFETERGKLRCTLYRGTKPKIITDMQFKKDLTALALISTSELSTYDEATIHIFNLSCLSQYNNNAGNANNNAGNANNNNRQLNLEKLREIRSIQFNFDISKKQSYASKDTKFQGPLIQFDPYGNNSNNLIVYSESDYIIPFTYDLNSIEPKKRLNDNLKQDGWIDPIVDS